MSPRSGDDPPQPERDLPSDVVIGEDHRGDLGPERNLADFTTPVSVLRLVPLAAVIGVLSAVVALVLLGLIGLITNLFYYQRLSLDQVSPAGHGLGVASVVIPVIGSLIVGLMARYGSEQTGVTGSPRPWRRSSSGAARCRLA